MTTFLKLVFFGNTKYSEIGARILTKVYPISLFVTIPERISGRDKTATPSPIKKLARRLKVPVLETDQLDQAVLDKISRLHPDFLIVEDYGLILPGQLLAVPKYAALNVHHSLLPKYRGPAPAPSAILNGDKVSGVSIIEMTEEVDAGDIVTQKSYQLSDQETTDSLLTKLNRLGGELLIEVITQYLKGRIKKLRQDPTQATFTKRLTKADGYFDIDKLPAPQILDRMIRAYFPWPNAWTRWSPQGESGPARIVKFYPGGLIQMEGKRAMPIKDFLNGYPDFPIKNLGW